MILEPLIFLSHQYNFREDSSNKKLDKHLSERSKVRRRKLIEVNIKVSFMLWLIEFVASIVMVFTPAIFGHGQVGTATGLIFVALFYFVLLPFFCLVNSSDVKLTIVEESWFPALRGIFNRSNVEVLPK